MTRRGKKFLRDRVMAMRNKRLSLLVGGSITLAVLVAAGSSAWMADRGGGWSLARTASATATGRVGVGLPAPDIAFTTSDGAEHRLSDFRGQPVMLWFFASWCSSCAAGTTAVVEKFDRLEKSGLRIVQLRLYENLGYPGPSAAEFARRYASAVYPSPSWLWGEASREASFTYDPRGYPDIYFLIDANGVVRHFDGSPNVTIDKIVGFAKAQSETIQKSQAE